jgi:hypothetical protein
MFVGVTPTKDISSGTGLKQAVAAAAAAAAANGTALEAA